MFEELSHPYPTSPNETEPKRIDKHQLNFTPAV